MSVSLFLIVLSNDLRRINLKGNDFENGTGSTESRDNFLKFATLYFSSALFESCPIFFVEKRCRLVTYKTVDMF